MTQWENLPEPRPDRPVQPVTPSWSAFTADPRVPANQHLRASDADRDVATRLVQQARAEGRLDAAEHDERALQAASARTLGELEPVVSDLMVASAAPGPPAGRPRAQVARVVTGWVGLAVLFNAIWLMTVLTTGHLLYYWPMWPMLGTGIPVMMTLFWSPSPEADARRRPPRRGETPQLPPAQEPPSDLR
jgi:hypothetical protein